jgi:AraC-like DNA-binding protein
MTPLITLEFAVESITVGITALTVALGFRAGTRATHLLAAFFVTLGLSVFARAVLTGWLDWLPAPAIRWLLVVNAVPVYLTGPLLYAYVSALLSGTTTSRQRIGAWHFVPCLLVGGFMIALAIWPTLRDWSFSVLALHVIIHAWAVLAVPYLAFAAWRLRDAPRLLEEVSADEASLRMIWLRRLVTLIAVVWLMVGFERISIELSDRTWRWPSVLLDVVMMIATYMLAWGGLRLGVLVPAGFADPQEVPADPAAARYARSSLSESELAQIAADLGKRMLEQRLYVDGALDLKKLSELSGWSPNYISQALNQQLGQNFFEFVNGFRIAAAQRCLADPGDQRSILDIALACGFGSKSTFNAVFKRMTGLTPSAFRRRNNTSDPAGSNDPTV